LGAATGATGSAGRVTSKPGLRTGDRSTEPLVGERIGLCARTPVPLFLGETVARCGAFCCGAKPSGMAVAAGTAVAPGAAAIDDEFAVGAIAPERSCRSANCRLTSAMSAVRPGDISPSTGFTSAADVAGTVVVAEKSYRGASAALGAPLAAKATGGAVALNELLPNAAGLVLPR